MNARSRRHLLMFALAVTAASPLMAGTAAAADIPIPPTQGAGPGAAYYRGPEMGFSVTCDGELVVPLTARGCAYNPYVGVDPSGVIPG